MDMLQSSRQYTTMTIVLPDSTTTLLPHEWYVVDGEPTDLVPFCGEIALWALQVSTCELSTMRKLTLSGRMLGDIFRMYHRCCGLGREETLMAFTHDLVQCFRSLGMPFCFPFRVGLTRSELRIRTLRD